ncbi:GAP family protein [Streptomyces sp. NPDC085932]|uniref:GAP family protein n=1 Tax=Streptomyces sp. NPDC085932 TaxID=3365741 RepID=UPI0037D72B1E
MVVDLLLIALAITLDPLPVMAFVLVVASDRGARKGLAFMLGWLTCFVTVIALVLLLTGGRPPEPRSPPSTFNLVAGLLIGVSLVAYGIHRRRRSGRGRPRGRPLTRVRRSPAPAPAHGPAAALPPQPEGSSSLTSRVDRGSAGAAAGLAVLLQPWGLVAAGATTVVEADTSHAATWLVLLSFCLLASGTLLAAELYVVLRPAVARARLLRLRTWMQDHAERAIVVGSIVIGLWLTGRSIYGLA